jgi:sugar/nucleoside kinase (ribokinase family)
MNPGPQKIMKLLDKGIGVVGSTTIDRVIAGNQSNYKLGGVTAYSGITYSRHGIDTIVVSNLSGQDLGILDRLHAENITVFKENSKYTTRFVNYYRGDFRRQEMPQTARPIENRQIQALLDKVGCLHLGPLHPLDIGLEALALLHNSNRAIFLDVQGYTRMVDNQKIYPSVSEFLETALSISQITKANEAELKSILGYFQMSLQALMRHFKIDEFVVTFGKDGGFVQKQSGKTFQYDAEKVKSPVDPTGAGDVFFAAYILGRFLGRKEIDDACRYAARVAAQQVAGKYITIDRLGL